MNNLINIIKDYKLDKSLILLYSGYFDSDNSGTNSHLINSNFFYLTGIDIPNLIVVYYKNSIKFIYDYSVNEWDDNNHKLKQIYNLYGKNTIIYEPYELYLYQRQLDLELDQVFLIVFHLKYNPSSQVVRMV